MAKRTGKKKGRHEGIPGGTDRDGALLRILMDNVSSGVAIYEARGDGRDFVFVDFNTAAEQIEQIKKEDLIGKSVLEVFPGVEQFGLLDVFRRVWQTGKPEYHPISVYRDERIAGWRENHVFRLPSGHIVAVYDDVTSRKRTELAARISEQCFRAIADYTYDWELWVSPAGRVLWTNPAAERVSGYTVRDITQMSDYPACLIHEQDRTRIGKAFRSALRGSTGNDIQFRVVRKDGEVTWVEMSWQPIYDDQGNPLGHRESIRDVTARKQAQDALRKAEVEKEMILDSLAELVAYQDTDMAVLWANRAACESVGLSRDQVIGRHCYELWGQRETPCEDCPVAQALQSGRSEQGERTTPDGKTWLIHAAPVTDDAGRIAGAVEICLDITEHKRMEHSLKQLQEHQQATKNTSPEAGPQAVAIVERRATPRSGARDE